MDPQSWMEFLKKYSGGGGQGSRCTPSPISYFLRSRALQDGRFDFFLMV